MANTPATCHPPPQTTRRCGGRRLDLRRAPPLSPSPGRHVSVVGASRTTVLYRAPDGRARGRGRPRTARQGGLRRADGCVAEMQLPGGASAPPSSARTGGSGRLAGSGPHPSRRRDRGAHLPTPAPHTELWGDRPAHAGADLAVWPWRRQWRGAPDATARDLVGEPDTTPPCSRPHTREGVLSPRRNTLFGSGASRIGRGSTPYRVPEGGRARGGRHATATVAGAGARAPCAGWRPRLDLGRRPPRSLSIIGVAAADGRPPRCAAGSRVDVLTGVAGASRPPLHGVWGGGGFGADLTTGSVAEGSVCAPSPVAWRVGGERKRRPRQKKGLTLRKITGGRRRAAIGAGSHDRSSAERRSAVSELPSLMRPSRGRAPRLLTVERREGPCGMAGPLTRDCCHLYAR